MGALWHCWLLLQLPAVLSSQSVAAHSAAAALAALHDVQRIEQQILDDEARRIKSGDVGPLEAYSFVHPSLGLLFDSALAALRHAVAASPEPELIVEAASLEKQLRDLLVAHLKEPLFFWHGPKWLIKSKLSRLLGSGPWYAKLQELSDLPAAPADLLGDKVAAKGQAAPLQDSKVPAIGVAVDDTFCTPGAPCSLVDELKLMSQLGKESGASAVHLLILPCPQGTLTQIRDALVAASALPKLYVSVSLPEGIFEAADAQKHMTVEKLAKMMEDYISEIQKAAGLTVHLVWLPYAAFKKQYWPATQQMLSKTRSWDYGVAAEVVQGAVAKKLLDRSPAPKAWLTRDDLLRPATEEAIAAALKANVVCVSLPRKEAISANLTALYFGAASNGEARSTWPLSWAWSRGLAATLPLATSRASTKATLQLPLLQAAAFAADHLELPGKPSGFPLQEALHSSRSTLKAAEVSIGVLPPKAKPQSETQPFVPGVSTKTLTGLEEKAKVFKENNYIIYAEDFFDVKTFAAIKEETQRLWRSTDIEANCNLDGKNRLGGYITDLINQNSSLYHLIYGNDPFRQWVSAVNAEGPMWPSDFPIELREYGIESQGMGCHPDLQMYKVPRKDLEFAFTVDNDSRCNVTFWDLAGKLHTVQTKPNSLMMVGVNAARHCVSSTLGGSRSILKFIYVGDYRKSNEFWYYTSNECDESNPNRQMLDDRRVQRLREVRSAEL